VTPNIQDNIKNSYKDYYQNLDGPIGGFDRFNWIVRTFFGGAPGMKILEVGCGEGSLLGMLKDRHDVYGADVSESGVLSSRAKGIRCSLIDAGNERLPFEDDLFDFVICLETIEHVENPHRLLWEVKRVLRPDGNFLVSIPGEGVDHPFIYPGLFTRKNFSEFLSHSGFFVRKTLGWGQAPLLSRWSHRVHSRRGAWMRPLADVVDYIGRKRNLFMRKRIGTPLKFAYCLNFLCRNVKTGVSRVEEVARQTTPT